MSASDFIKITLESGLKYETIQLGRQLWLKKLGSKNKECFFSVKQFDSTISVIYYSDRVANFFSKFCITNYVSGAQYTSKLGIVF